jgi:Ni,Fe-hydrogenase III large subunit
MPTKIHGQELFNFQAVARAAVPLLRPEPFMLWVATSVREGRRLMALFGTQPSGQESEGQERSGVEVYAVLGSAETGALSVARTRIAESYTALTPRCPAAQGFERELYEQFGAVGLKPEGHPWLKPVRFENPDGPRIGVMDFFTLRGAEAHEVAVGPVHAGIIEPGHFRFQCHGENVLHLEISLGYQHRGVEKAMPNAPSLRAMRLAETVAGDSSVAHGWAYCGCLEALARRQIPERATLLRAMALELERLANHTGDLGALAGDVGYLPTMSFCGRLRGDFLNMSALLCGNRFGRTMLKPGGVGHDADAQRLATLRQRLDATVRDVQGAFHLMFHTPSVLARFEQAGALTPEMARELGLVGPPARACGLELDSRRDFPAPGLRPDETALSVCATGDVYSRARVRFLEIEESAAAIRRWIDRLQDGDVCSPLGALARDSLAVAVVEGWRGEVCHVALTSAEGRLERYKIVDPSFHNWFGLAMALRNEQISDFPLCNKSFNLSYCGHDL